MASIFDMFGGSPQSQGLLAAAAQILQASGPSRTPTGLGQILGGGISAYQQTEQQARQQGMADRLLNLKVQDAEADLKNQESARDRQKRIAQRLAGGLGGSTAQSQAGIGGYDTTYNGTPYTQAEAHAAMGAAKMMNGYEPDKLNQVMALARQGMSAEQAAGMVWGGGNQSPSSLSANAGGNMTEAYVQRLLTTAQAYAEEGDIDGANKLYEQAAKLRPKFSNDVTWVNGADGKPIGLRLADDGSRQQLDGLTPREKLEFRDGGNALYGIDQFTGEQRAKLAKGASPDALLSAQVQREGFNRADARAERSNPANKPLPAAALKMQQSELDALSTASGIDGQLGRIQGQLDSGKLSFGPVSNLVNQARNAAGMSSEESRNQASFRSTLEKLRNDSLRLNAGVQTDGDAQRAWNELFTNLNDTELVKQRLGEIRGINQRAAQIRRLNVDSIRGNYGHEPLDTSQYEQPVGAPTQQQQRAAQPAAGGKVATLSDIAATARASGRTTAEVTAALKAKGYTIGGQ